MELVGTLACTREVVRLLGLVPEFCKLPKWINKINIKNKSK